MEDWGYYIRAVDWTTVVAAVFIGTWSLMWFCQILAIVYGLRKLHKPIVRDASVTYPGVSIAKPLVNLADPNLQRNLETFFHLDYAPYEILFCVQSEHQVELIAMIKSLMAKYPNVDSRLFVGAQNVGVNPKINNMMNAYDNAKYPYFLISDGGIKVTRDTLLDMVNTALLSSAVGLVHQLPLMLNGDWSSSELPPSRAIEKVYFGTAQARMYLSANALGFNCVTSMSCLVKRSALDDVGGLRAFSCYIGEDFFMGRALLRRGYKILLSSQPVQQDPGLTSRAAWQDRMIRWMHLRMAALPQLVLLEPLSESVVLGPLAAVAFLWTFGLSPLVFYPCQLLAWFAFDYLLFAAVENKRPPFSLWCFVKAWVVRELSFCYIYACAVTLRTLSWGGRRYRLHWGGKASEVGGDVASLPV